MFLIEYHFNFFRQQTILKFTLSSLTIHSRTPWPQFTIIVYCHHMITTTTKFNYLILHNLWCLNIIQMTMSQLTTIVISSTTTPCVEFIILIECCTMKITTTNRYNLFECFDSCWLTCFRSQLFVKCTTPCIHISIIK